MSPGSNDNARKGRPGHTVDRAAGGIVARLENDEVQVVLIRMKRGGSARWSLPKGHFKKNESAEQTAVREVTEETGLTVEILTGLGSIDYWFTEKGVVYHKFVEYFAMRPTGGSFDDHDDEVTDVRWFRFDAALRSMAYENERSIVATNAGRLRDVLDAMREDRQSDSR